MMTGFLVVLGRVCVRVTMKFTVKISQWWSGVDCLNRGLHGLSDFGVFWSSMSVV